MDIYKIKTRPRFDNQEILPEEFTTKHDAQVFFESEGMDYDFYHIYKTVKK